MSRHFGSTQILEDKLSRLKTSNARIARFASEGKYEQKDRQTFLTLCGEIKQLIESLPNDARRRQLVQEFQTELARFDASSALTKQQNDSFLHDSLGSDAFDPSQPLSGQGIPLYGSMQQQLHRPQQQQQQQQQQLYDPTREHLLTQDQEQSIDIEQLERSRQEKLRLEQDALALASMVKDIHQLVHEQGEQLDIIEQNVMSTNQNVVSAHEELEQAAEYQTATASWLRWAGLAGLIAIILIAIIVLVVFVKRSKK